MARPRMSGDMPHRYSLTSVTRFLPIFNLVLSQGDFPLRIEINPSDLQLSHETVSARLRDAARAISQGHVITSITDTDRFTRLWNQYYVTSDEGRVFVVPKTEKENRGKGQVTGTIAPSPRASSSVNVSTLATLTAKQATPDVLRAFATLLGLRILTGRVDIVGQVPQELQSELMDKHDIVFTSDGTNTTLL